MNKPNFFIVGTPKAGTTSLYYYLEEHPEIYMSPIKETNYFSFSEIEGQGLYYTAEEYVRTAADYDAQFAGVTNEKAIGEASVSYLFYPEIPNKIKEFNPDARIIIVLRNPVDRGFSHYLMDKRLGFVNLSFDDIVDKKFKKKSDWLYYQQYITIGFYYEQVKRFQDTFGSEKVKVLFYEDIISNINGVVKDIYKFLEVEPTYIADTNQRHNVFLAPKTPLIEKLYALKTFRKVIKRIFGEAVQSWMKSVFFTKEKKPQLSPALKAELTNLFKADIVKTSELLNRDLSRWLQ